MRKYTVVIPLYNKKNYIRKALDSVLNQTFSDIEVVVIDDGSTDDSLSEIKDIVDARLRFIKQKNAGVSVARNVGIKAANGKYISFLDADDYWHSDYLETIDRLTIEYPESDIYVTAYRILFASKRINFSSNINEPLDGCLSSYWKTLKNRYDFVWTSATTIKKQALIDAGFFSPGELVGQDLDLIARVAQNNPRVAYSTKRCVDYNRSAENNARIRVKVAYPKAYLSVLSCEMKNPQRTKEEVEAIALKYDKKMIAYIFTLILAGKSSKARDKIKEWVSKHHWYRFMLWLASYVPNSINNWIYRIRLKIF